MAVYLDIEGRINRRAFEAAFSEVSGMAQKAGALISKDLGNAMGKGLSAFDTSKIRSEIAALTAAHADAERAATSAASRIAVAETRLAEVKARSGAESSRALAAEVALADAHAKSAVTARNAEAAHSKLNDAVAAGASATTVASRAWNAAGVGSLALLGGTMVETTKRAADFQQGLMKLHAAAGETGDMIGGQFTGNMKVVSDGILQMSGKVGYSVGELTNAMYTIEKAGFRGSDGLKVLQAAAQGAGSEQADLMEVVNGLTTSLTDFNVKPEDSARLMSQMVTAVGSAKTSFQDFAGALHSVEPVAAAAHLKLEDVWGTLAQITQSGTSPEQATENMRNAINAFTGQSQPARDAMAQFGINADEVSQKLSDRGLAGTMQYLYDTVQSRLMPGMKVNQGELLKNVQASDDLNEMITKMSPNAAKLATELKNNAIGAKEFMKAARNSDADDFAKLSQFFSLNEKVDGFSKAMRTGRDTIETVGKALRDMTGTVAGQSVALQVSGEHTEEANRRIKDIATTYTNADGTVKGFDESQSTLNAKMRDAHAAFGAASAEIGSAFVPVMMSVANVAKTVGDEMAKHPGVTHAVVTGLEAIAGAWAAIKAINIVGALLKPITTGLLEMTAAEDAAAASAGGMKGALAGLAGAAGPVIGTAVAADIASGQAQDSKNPIAHATGDAFRHNWFSAYGIFNNLMGRHAHGGAIHGHGPKGHDSILSWLAPGEHVLTHHDVAAMGGHSAVYAMRNALHRAGGGAIGPDVEAAYSMAGTRYSQGSRTDCSGMVGRVILGALGIGGGSLPTTQNMGQWLAQLGFRSGVGPPGTISVGWYNHGSAPNDGHAAMTLSDGENAESGGSHGNFLIGAGAAGASSSQFDHHMFLPELFGEGSATGMPGGFGGGGGMGGGGGFGGGGGMFGGGGGYYTANPAKVASAQEQLRHIDAEIADAEKRKTELKADAKQSTRDSLDEEIRHLKEERGLAEGRLQEAERGTFHAGRGGKGGMGELPVPLADNPLSGGISGLVKWAVSALADLALAPMESAISAAMGFPGGSTHGQGLIGIMGDIAAGSGGGGALGALSGGPLGGADFGGGGVSVEGPSGGYGGGGGGGAATSASSGSWWGLTPSSGGTSTTPKPAASAGPGIHTQNDYKLFQAGVLDADGNVISGGISPDLSALLHPPGSSSSGSPMLAPGDAGLLGGGPAPSQPGLQGSAPGYGSGPTSQVPSQTVLPFLTPRHYSSGGPVGSDTIPAWLSPGEWVLTPDQAKMWQGAQYFDGGSDGGVQPAPGMPSAALAQPGGQGNKVAGPAGQQPGAPGAPGQAQNPNPFDIHQPPSGADTRPGVTTPGASSRTLNEGMPASGGIGFSGGILGAAEGAASSGADLFAPGSGAALQMAFQLINRTASYGAQMAGIAAEGLLQTFIPNDSPLSDFGQTLPGRLLGGIAGVRPAAPNTAGQTKPPLTGQQPDGGGNAMPGMAGGGDNLNFYGDVHVHQPNDLHDMVGQIQDQRSALQQSGAMASVPANNQVGSVFG